MGMLHDIASAFGKALRPIHAGDKKLASHDPRLGGPETINVTSSSFTKDGPLARKNAQEGNNLSPSLSWTGVPEAAKELVVLVEDPDAPLPQPFVHWMVYKLPPETTELPEGIGAEGQRPRGGMQGKNSLRRVGYTGAAPPAGHGKHHYHFEVFALDATLPLDGAVKRNELVDAMAGHVIAKGEVVGTYER